MTEPSTTDEHPENQPEQPAGIHDRSRGVWIVNTKTSRYLVDLDSQIIVRSPDTTRSEPRPGPPVAALRLDHDSIPLITLVRCRIGSPMIAILDVRKDGIRTRRETTDVTRIQSLANAGASVGFKPPENLTDQQIAELLDGRGPQ